MTPVLNPHFDVVNLGSTGVIGHYTVGITAYKRVLVPQGHCVLLPSIATLWIPREAYVRRPHDQYGVMSKCRASMATVQKIEGYKGEHTSIFAVSDHNRQFAYIVGHWLHIENFNHDPDTECGAGIHYFETLDEARRW